MEDQPKGRSPSEASGCFSHKRLLFPIEDDRDDDGEHGPEGELTEDNGKKRLAFDSTKQAGELVAAIP